MLGPAADNYTEVPCVRAPIAYGDNASSWARNTPCAFPWDLHASIHHHTIALNAKHNSTAYRKLTTAPEWSMCA